MGHNGSRSLRSVETLSESEKANLEVLLGSPVKGWPDSLKDWVRPDREIHGNSMEDAVANWIKVGKR